MRGRRGRKSSRCCYSSSRMDVQTIRISSRVRRRRLFFPPPRQSLTSSARRADIIIEFAQRLDDVRAPPFQLGVQFIQIGNDPEAREFLQDLDDNLKPMLGVRDMVDTTPFEGSITPEFILKVRRSTLSLLSPSLHSPLYFSSLSILDTDLRANRKGRSGCSGQEHRRLSSHGVLCR